MVHSSKHISCFVWLSLYLFGLICYTPLGRSKSWKPFFLFTANLDDSRTFDVSEQFGGMSINVTLFSVTRSTSSGVYIQSIGASIDFILDASPGGMAAIYSVVISTSSSSIRRWALQRANRFGKHTKC